jgi:hypothetical protein
MLPTNQTQHSFQGKRCTGRKHRGIVGRTDSGSRGNGRRKDIGRRGSPRLRRDRVLIGDFPSPQSLPLNRQVPRPQKAYHPRDRDIPGLVSVGEMLGVLLVSSSRPIRSGEGIAGSAHWVFLQTKGFSSDPRAKESGPEWSPVWYRHTQRQTKERPTGSKPERVLPPVATFGAVGRSQPRGGLGSEPPESLGVGARV